MKTEIKTEVNQYKTHTTIKKTLLINGVEVVTLKNIDRINFKIYFSTEIDVTTATVRAINKFLLSQGAIKEKIKGYKNFLNNSYLKKYKNYKVLEFERYF